MSTASTASSPTTGGGGARGAVRLSTRVFNPVAMLLAGTPLLPLYGVISHRGRRSGKLFRTPVVVRPTRDGFIVPMPFGEGTDWYRNIKAAGECVIRWKGRDYVEVQPEVIVSASVAAVFGATQLTAMERLGIKQCLRLHHKTPTM
jgi:deazaflavin-dependent oxidoreductase (nitroreductase family)